MILGVTGVFGSGKTAVAEILAKHGYKHIDADEVGHKILNKDEIKDKVVKEFGTKILTDNKIDRVKLKNIVFYDKDELIKLNKILHPAIIDEIKSIIANSRNKNIVVDGALLIEAKATDFLDKLIVVKIHEKEQIRRALSRGKYTMEEIKNILYSQLPQKEKLKYADIIIDNSGDLSDTEKQLAKLTNLK